MKNILKISKINLMALAVLSLIFVSSCKDDDMDGQDMSYIQTDQMGRPAINTVFNSSDEMSVFINPPLN